MKLRTVVLLTLALSGCKLGELFYPAVPPNSVQYIPPGIYDTWQSQVRSCLDSLGLIREDIGSVYNAYWYAVLDSVWQTERAGLYDRYHNAFWISMYYVEHKKVISHELIHSFGYRNSDHGTAPFTECELYYKDNVIDHDSLHIPELDSLPMYR